MNFKEYMGEATAQDFKAQGYGGTSDRTKFQLGDWVVVTDSQTKRGEKYINQPGKIVGYKPFSQIVKYAVEFSDGQADAYFGQMIVGPFKDEATAIKYSKQIKKLKQGSILPQIAPSDIRGYVDKPLDANLKFEAYMKQLLVSEPFDMQWLDTPMQFSDGKYTVTILAVKPTAFKKYGAETPGIGLKITNSSLQNFLRNNICFLRQNNAVNSKLVTQTYMRGLPSFSGQSPYLMTMMWMNVSSLRYRVRDKNRDVDFFNKKELTAGLKELDKISVQGVAIPVSLAKNPKELITAFKLPYEILSNSYDPRTLFDMYYGVIEQRGQKIIVDHIRADENTLKYFEGYVQNYQPQSYGNTELEIRTDSPDMLVVPKGMRNIVLMPKTENIKPTIKDFSFMSSVIKLKVFGFTIQSLNGLPETMDELRIEDCNLPSLHGLPKKIDMLNIKHTNLKDFTGAEDSEIGSLQGWDNNFTSLKGLPKAEHYGLGERFTEKQIQKVIDDREMLKNVDPDVAGAWSKVISRL